MNCTRNQATWEEVSETSPCPICGRPDWCSRSADGMAMHCRREANTAITVGWAREQRAEDKNGAPYTVWRSTNGKPKSAPAISVGESPKKVVSPKILDSVYRKFLDSLTTTPSVVDDLKRRGLPADEIESRKYGVVDDQLDSAVAGLVEAGLGKHLPRVPGFYKQDGVWTCNARSGLLIPVRNTGDQIVAIKVRRHDTDGGKLAKYFYASSRTKGGPGPGTPVHVPLHANVPNLRVIRITEGELKADIATALTGTLTLGLPGVNAFAKAEAILKELGAKTVVIAFDADYRHNPVVAKSLRDAIKLFSQSFDVKVEHWPEKWGKGIDDILAAGHKPKLICKRGLTTFVDQLSKQCNENEPPTRPTITINTREKSVNDKAVDALATDPTIFQRGGALVHILASEDPARIPGDGQDQKKNLLIWRPTDSPRIVRLPSPVLRERLSAVADWRKRNAKRKVVPAHPPDWTVNAISARGFWPNIRPLTGVITGPALRADGTVLAQHGYDPATGLFCNLGISLPDIPTNPTRNDIQSALRLLLDVVVDFPFDSEFHRSGWLALPMTMIARPAFPDPSPLSLLDANVAGAGKTLLCDVASMIACGRGMPRMTNPRDDEEARKRITALALAGDTVVLIDNIEGSFGCASLDAALTSHVWKDRILGRSEIVELPLIVTWCATGNNVILVGDMRRRVLHIRLTTPLEKPDERQDFKHPGLLEWVKRERGQLLAAMLTLFRGYIAAGRPDQNLTAWGSFEGWSALVRQTLVWAGLPDPAETRQELMRTADEEGKALAALLTGLQAFDPKQAGLTVSEIIRLITDPKSHHKAHAEAIREAIAVLCPSGGPGLPGSRSIGMKLHHLKQRTVGGRCLDRRDRNNTATWFVRDVSSGTTGTTGTISNPSRGKISSGDGVAQKRKKKKRGKGAASSPRSPRSPRPVASDKDVEVF